MIEPTLIGRLGNFMFEVAAAYAYSLKHNMEYNIPIDAQNYVRFFPNLITTLRMPDERLTYKEPSHAYNEIPYHKDIKILEYFQSELYFKEYRNEVVKLFNLPYEKKAGVCSIHVRRGDYLIYHTHFPPVDYRYLQPAIKFMSNQVGVKKFMVFGDDPYWNKGYFTKDAFPGCEFEFSVGRNEYEDMAAMSCCEHNIIANSTFSWWGAWLNQNPDKIVVSPSFENWFGKGAKEDTKDIIPKSWYQIKF